MIEDRQYFHSKHFNDKKTQKIWNKLNEINEEYPYTMLQYVKLVVKEHGYKIK